MPVHVSEAEFEQIVGGALDSIAAPFRARMSADVVFQSHIERWCATRAELVDQVTDTVLQEAAHYFSMDHDEMRQTRLHL